MKKILLLAFVVLAASPAYAQVDLGTSSSATNPQRTGDATTGLFSSTTGAVSVSSGGTEMMRVNGTGVGIGTTSPAFVFQVDPTSTGGIALFGPSYNGGTSYNTGNKQLVIEAWSGIPSLELCVNNVNCYTQAVSTSGYYSLTDAASNTILYAKTGNVGIGTTSPTSLLHTVDSAARTASYVGIEHAVSDTSSTASVTKTGMDIQSTGTWNGTSAVNIGLNVNATGGTTNYAALFSGGNVGIGTTSPAKTLEVNGTAKIDTGLIMPLVYPPSDSTTAIQIDKANGTSNVVDIDTTNGRVGIGMTPGASLDIDTTTANTAGTVTVQDVLAQSTGSMGNGFGPVISFSTQDIHTHNTIGALGAVQHGASNTGDLVFYTTLSGTSTEKMRILSGGNVGIGTTNPAQALEVNGQVQIDSWGVVGATTTVCEAGNILALCSSSIRYKENVKNFDRGLDDLMRMRPVKFKWKDRDENDFGLIAEEMSDIDPLYVTYHDGRIQGVKYSQLTAVIINAVKEQQEEIADLKQQIADLKAAIAGRH